MARLARRHFIGRCRQSKLQQTKITNPRSIILRALPTPNSEPQPMFKRWRACEVHKRHRPDCQCRKQNFFAAFGWPIYRAIAVPSPTEGVRSVRVRSATQMTGTIFANVGTTIWIAVREILGYIAGVRARVGIRVTNVRQNIVAVATPRANPRTPSNIDTATGPTVVISSRARRSGKNVGCTNK